MKTFYHVTFVGEFGIAASQKRFSTLTSFYQFMRGYLKCRDYVTRPRVHVVRYWQLSSTYCTAGSVDFLFLLPYDVPTFAYVKRKMSAVLNGSWYYDMVARCYLPFRWENKKTPLNVKSDTSL